MKTRWLRGLSVGAALLARISTLAAAEQTAPKPDAKAAVAQNSQSEIAKYCLSNASAAADAHLAWQKAQLTQMEEELKQKIAELQAKEEQDKKWVLARQEFLKKGEDSVVAIFSRMRPESAALQLSAMQDDMAAAVLSKLNPRNASAILDEIDPPRAARLTDVMAGKSQPLQEAKKDL